MLAKPLLLLALAGALLLAGVGRADAQERPAPASGATAAPKAAPVADEQLREVFRYTMHLLLSTLLGEVGEPLPAPPKEQVYFCRTCVIYAYKPEPCVCCGMEMELLPDAPARRF